jgi:hypothetical protein
LQWYLRRTPCGAVGRPSIVKPGIIAASKSCTKKKKKYAIQVVEEGMPFVIIRLAAPDKWPVSDWIDVGMIILPLFVSKQYLVASDSQPGNIKCITSSYCTRNRSRCSETRSSRH